MTILLAIGFIIVCLIATTNALPTRTHREVSAPSSTEVEVSCNFDMRGRTGEQLTSHVGLNQCIRVDNTNIPSPLKITCNELTSHTVQRFSTGNCDDESVIENYPLTSEQNDVAVILRINERTPICSFRLGRTPFPLYPVKIFFDDNIYISENTECKNLCDSSSGSLDTKGYPQSVQILETDGAVANNLVHLFTESNCEGERIIQTDGTYDIRHGTNLVSLTRGNRATTHSIWITARS